MRRREFLTFLGSAAAAWPVAARAQQPAIPVVGFLHAQSLVGYREPVAAFHRGLAEAGYVEGRNVAIEYRWAEGHYDRLPALAAELVRRQVAMIVTGGGSTTALAAKAATATIPIVFNLGVDPVEVGLVKSLNRPSGNLTGVTIINVEVIAKRLELLHQVVPAATSIALLVNPTNSVGADADARELQAAARALGLHLLILNASSDGEIDAAFATLVIERAGALVVGGDSFFVSRYDRLAALAARHVVPAIYQSREAAASGGLVSYGADIPDSYRQVGVYTGRVLKGEKPADLPVQQATKVELTINLKTVKALGLTVPLALLTRADEVIE
jgi:putative ABC transport system substrate-binding protein